MSPTLLTATLEALVDRDQLRGVVFRGFGAGDVPTDRHHAFTYLREREIPVVVTTQAPDGASSLDVNQPAQLLRDGGLAIPAHYMSIERSPRS